MDLNDSSRQPFKALGGHKAGTEHRYVAKRDTDCESSGRRVQTSQPKASYEPVELPPLSNPRRAPPRTPTHPRRDRPRAGHHRGARFASRAGLTLFIAAELVDDENGRYIQQRSDVKRLIPLRHRHLCDDVAARAAECHDRARLDSRS